MTSIDSLPQDHHGQMDIRMNDILKNRSDRWPVKDALSSETCWTGQARMSRKAVLTRDRRCHRRCNFFAEARDGLLKARTQRRVVNPKREAVTGSVSLVWLSVHESPAKRPRFG